MSTLLPHTQIAAIRERCDTVTINGERPPGVFGSVHDLLRHADAQAARIEAALTLAKEIENHCPCGARPESPRTHPHVIGCPVYKLLRVIGGEKP